MSKERPQHGGARPTAPGDARSGPTRRALLWGALFASGVAAAGAGGFLFGRTAKLTTKAGLPILGAAPTYRLENQLGQSVSSQAFRGRIQIVTFLDPYCTEYCPLIAAHLANFATPFSASPMAERVQIVAFNINPWETGPKEMSAFLKEYGWDPKNLFWQYLTGSPRDIRRIVEGGFHAAFQRVPVQAQPAAPVLVSPGDVQPVIVNPLAEAAKPRFDIVHSDTLEIVDGQGRIRKIFSEADRLTDQRLMRPIKWLTGDGRVG